MQTLFSDPNQPQNLTEYPGKFTFRDLKENEANVFPVGGELSLLEAKPSHPLIVPTAQKSVAFLGGTIGQVIKNTKKLAHPPYPGQ